jgi:hypothetical protein
MIRDRDLKKIVRLESPALADWIKSRLSGLACLLPLQISKGEDPEDLVVALYQSDDAVLKERIKVAVIDLLKEQVACVNQESDLPLLSRLVFLADALELSSAAPFMIPFLFRKEFQGKSTPHGDLQELILRTLLGLDPKRFDSRFWELYLKEPRFVAVAVRGLAVTDPPAAVRNLPKLFELATSGGIETDAKLVLWRISSGWDHREFLKLLAESMRASGAAAQSGINAAVEELPFESTAKELFKTTTRPRTDLVRAALMNKESHLDSLLFDSTAVIEVANMNWAVNLGASYVADEQEIVAAEPAVVRQMGYADLQEHASSPQSTWISIGPGFTKSIKDLHWPRRGQEWTQMTFAGFIDQGLPALALSVLPYDEEYSEGGEGYDIFSTRGTEVHLPSRVSFGIAAGTKLHAAQWLFSAVKNNINVIRHTTGPWGDLIETVIHSTAREMAKEAPLYDYSLEP